MATVLDHTDNQLISEAINAVDALDMIDHAPVFRPTDPDRPGWVGPSMGDGWHRRSTSDERRRPSRE